MEKHPAIDECWLVKTEKKKIEDQLIKIDLFNNMK